MSGYAHEAYAASLTEVGSALELPRSGGWILVRSIPGSDRKPSGLRDAIGPYPIFSCLDWRRLAGDLAEPLAELVSLTIVTDPFGRFSESELRQAFPDLVRPFKEHFVVDLRRSLDDYLPPHHRRNVAKAGRQVEVERCPDPPSLTPIWRELYGNLVVRHHITGPAAFPPETLSRQLEVPGAVAFAAADESATIGMTVWYVNESVAYYHLGAYSAAGYAAGASFAIFDHALRYFAAAGLEWLDLGGAPGLTADGRDGLSRFKRGWATGTRPVYLCGRIFDRRRYRELVEANRSADPSYFPAYRAPQPVAVPDRVLIP